MISIQFEVHLTSRSSVRDGSVPIKACTKTHETPRKNTCFDDISCQFEWFQSPFFKTYWLPMVTNLVLHGFGLGEVI